MNKLGKYIKNCTNNYSGTGLKGENEELIYSCQEG